MRSKRKVIDVAEAENENVRAQLDASAPAVRKDLHLVEAALATDQIVVSLDDQARANLSVEATREVMWINAVDEGGHAVYWLDHGANPVERWMLGYHG